MSRLRSRLAETFGPKKSRVVSVTSRGGGGSSRRSSRSTRNLMNALQAQQQKFNVGQEKRFSQVNIMAARTRRRTIAANKKALREARKVGKEQKKELGRRATKSKASSQQSLTNRGLGNTTIVESQNRAIEGDFARQSRAVDEDVSRRRVGVLENQAGLEFGTGQLGIDTFLSRRDQAPNISQTLQLLQQLGQG